MTGPDFTGFNPPITPKSSNSSTSGSGNIKVAVRLCPLSDPKASKKRRRSSQVYGWGIEHDGKMASMIQTGMTRKIEGRSVFHLDRVFDEETQTAKVYEGIAKHMVPTVLNGKHATMFAYGQTGAGKTYTMQGGAQVVSGQAGIIQLVARDLFRSIENDTANREFEVKVSYFEIYNEAIRDLLTDDDDSASYGGRSRGSVDSVISIRTNDVGKLVVNVTKKTVASADEALQALLEGNRLRHTAATEMNTYSSRSHSVFRLTVESRPRIDEGFNMKRRGSGIVRVSDFNLVDLAGSEGVRTAKTTGIRQREAATINKSLLALTTVIQALSLPANQKPRHINYRDSKLTRILQPHLSGNAEMAILCCASRSKNCIEETRSTLKFASRAKLVRVKPKINEVIDDRAIIQRLQTQLFEMRKQLELAENKLEEEQAQKAAVKLEEEQAQNAAIVSPSASFSDIIADKKNQETEYSETIADKLLDVEKPAKHYEKDALDLTNSSEASTANMSSEYDKSFDHKSQASPSRDQIVEESHRKSVDSPVLWEDHSFSEQEVLSPDDSLKVCTQLSHACDTIKEVDVVHEDSARSAPNGRFEKTISPFQTIENLNDKGNKTIPNQVAIIDTSTSSGNNMCLMDQLREYEARIHFLEEKLERSDSIIEANARDLQRARNCIRDLVKKNGEINGAMITKRKEDAKKYFEVGEVMIEQHSLLKTAMQCSLFFFLTGSHEYFLASAFFVWLTLETNLSA